MIRLRRSFACALLPALIATAMGTAGADVPGFPPTPVGATIVSDAHLAGIRGKYIAPRGTGAIALLQDVPVFGAAPMSDAKHVGSASLLGIPSGGSVTYFGVAMESTWTVGTGAQAVSESAGLNVGVDASTKSVTIQTWSTGSGQGIPPATGTDSITGTPLANITSGVGQSIQVAGNGSTATNEATVTYGGTPLTQPVAILNTCGAQCTESTANGALGVAIITSRGSVNQSIGDGMISQSVQAWGDGNSIVNQLGVSVQSQPSLSQTSGGLPTILETLTGLP